MAPRGLPLFSACPDLRPHAGEPREGWESTVAWRMNIQDGRVSRPLALPAPGSCFSGTGNGAAWALWEPGHAARHWSQGAATRLREGDRSRPGCQRPGCQPQGLVSARCSHKQTVRGCSLRVIFHTSQWLLGLPPDSADSARNLHNEIMGKNAISSEAKIKTSSNQALGAERANGPWSGSPTMLPAAARAPGRLRTAHASPSCCRLCPAVPTPCSFAGLVLTPHVLLSLEARCPVQWGL